MNTWTFLFALAALLSISRAAPTAPAKRAVANAEANSRQRLRDPGFEEKGAGRLAAWSFWGEGYEVSAAEKRSGRSGIACRLDDAKLQRGASQTVQLDQSAPAAVTASGWSKAAGVSGSPDSNYSIYLDLLYQDGTPLWGQTGDFSAGTHDWEKRTVVVLPSKPIKQVTVHAIFRGHTGAAWFDDFELRELQAPPGSASFDGVYVLPEESPAPRPDDWVEIFAVGNVRLQLSPPAGLLSLNGGPAGGGLLLRDVESGSDFHRLCGRLNRAGDGWRLEGEAPELGLRCRLDFSRRAEALLIEAALADTRQRDRAVSAYFAVPVAADRWHDDPRRSRPVQGEGEFRNTVPDGAGAQSCHSLYPLGCVAAGRLGAALAMPLDAPRLSRFIYNPVSKELFAAFDFGLTAAARKFPSTASFSLALFETDARWGMRSALAEFYRLFPDHFEKRVRQEGLWQAFADIAAVERPEDFHFAFKEGNNNVAWDDAHGILTFVYTEPMTYWQRLPREIPRAYEASASYLEGQVGAAQEGTRELAAMVMASAARNQDGKYSLTIENAPWCDGAVYGLNADPDLPAAGGMNKGLYELRGVEKAFELRGGKLPGWSGFGEGYAFDEKIFRGGRRSIRCALEAAGGARGASQRVEVNQSEAAPLLLSGWSKAEAVSGGKDEGYSLYADLVLEDGSSLFGQIAPFDSGTHDWQMAEAVIQARQAVKSAAIHCLFRNRHAGTVWFDDLFFGTAGSKDNLLRDADFESDPEPPPVLDGAYIDSLEGWSGVKNFNAGHFASADLPLTFDPQSKKPMILTIMTTYEFALELHRRMRGRGKLLMANAALHRYSFFAWLLDFLGTETNWNPGNRWRPMSDAEMLFKRALCYQKPYCFLQNTHFDDFTPVLTEKYMRRCLFYGMFPGFFSENAATGHFFENPRWYNAARPLFRKYLPLIQEIAAAGWEPVTHAVTDQEKVCLERFGSAGKPIYFAVLNDSPEPRSAAVAVDARALSLGDQTAAELIEGQAPKVSRSAAGWRWEERLEGEEVRLYRIGEK